MAECKLHFCGSSTNYLPCFHSSSFQMNLTWKNTKGFFMENNSTTKAKYETLYNNYKAGQLKNDNIVNKIVALQCS